MNGKIGNKSKDNEVKMISLINYKLDVINDIVNKENVNEAIKEFEDFAARSNGNTTGIFDYDKLFPEAKEIYNILLEIKKRQ